MELEKEIQQVKPFRNEYHKATVNIIFTGKWMLQFIALLLKSYNLTHQQYNILRILRGKFPNSISVMQIRDRMLDKMSDVSRIIENLRKKALIMRTACNDDRRRMDVRITEKGLKLLAEIESENEIMDEHLSSLNEKEIRQLNQLLDKLRD